MVHDMRSPYNLGKDFPNSNWENYHIFLELSKHKPPEKAKK